MKTTQFVRISPLTLLLIQLSPAAHAITFTGDTYIGVNDTTFDGMDIIVSNCTLSVDGPHAFASIQILTGGVITHTLAANGVLPAPIYSVTGEAHVLSSNAVSSLNLSNVNAATVVVRDLSASLIYTNGTDYEIIPEANGITGLQLLPGSSIAEGSTNLVAYQYSGSIVPSGLTLTVSNNVLIEAGGSINVDGKGFGGGQGPGRGFGTGSPSSGSGAGHGGNGGKGVGLGGSGLVYDSILQPTGLGSGGGAGYNGLGGLGGGAVKLVIGGALLVDGHVSANGLGSVTNRSGGGSGGSIWVSAQTVAGSGAISANGGDGELPAGGGGGGGRISIQSGINVFSGLITAFGGNGYAYGGAGTIDTGTGSQATQQVLVDNGGHQGLTTLLQASEQSVLTAQAGAVIYFPGLQSLGGLLIRSNASLIVSNTVSSMLSVSGNAIVEAGGMITADGMGSPANQGRGAGRISQALVTVGGGGGYGGNGGSANALNAWGGLGYGSYTAPIDLGSGGANYLGIGPGSAGGGAIHLSVIGTLIVNGTISANGLAGLGDGSGGGSGGSVWITAQRLAGAGIISADGGDGNGTGLYAGGGGGGGRIAIQALNFFLGTTSARGGNGYMRGGAGTVYFGGTQTPAQLVIDNAGSAGTNTILSFFTSSTADVTVSGAAVVTFSGPPYLHNLLIASNSWVVVSNLVLSTSGDVSIEDGGGIVADGNGYGASQGPGAGRYTTITLGGYVGGGGGYGGFGGTAAGVSPGVAAGGVTYGSVAEPTDRGSGGGGPLLSSTGGTGGGAIRLTTLGALKVDGVISANGTAGLQGGGGGSAGSLWLNAGSISGNGTIRANGGDGSGNGGGGGGGRIALEYGTNIFSGGVAAHGGNGINRGGAGTIYSKAKNSSASELVIDNGGQPGSSTTWLPTGIVDLTITGGAVVATPVSQVLSNLVIGPNSALALSNQLPLTIRGDALIQEGGAITADGAGYGSGQGLGAGRLGDSQNGVSGGGGGYGGNGASGVNAIASGGATYGSLTAPTIWGSGGGGAFQSRQGGSGGGAIQMVVSGTLTVLGRISANGDNGLQGGGGGSGGSIYITARTLLGAGQISANGGMGGPQSGGGGGGRIAILLNQPNIFNGIITAFGGDGYARGGAGTVFIRPNSIPSLNGQLFVDNGGALGTNTSWLSSSGTFDLNIRGGGIAVAPPQQVINNLLIETNGWLRLSNQTLTVLGNAKVEAGGGIMADGTGFGNGQGTGAGRASNVPGYGVLGGGGGYGGDGGNASAPAPVASGGLTYGSLTTPLDRGSSGGGAFNSDLGSGGPGGGAIQLIISGALELEGMLSAQGGPGAIPGAGGGSGGSIWVTAGALTGSGLITANGGSGNGYGGGGGGGRIALEFALNTFAGPITAFGGGGSSSGGAGTIYLKPKSQPVGQVIVDNGGQFGSHTTLGSLTSPYDLSIKGGASADVTNASLLLSNLDIGWGGSLSVSPSLKQMSVTVLRDALIEPGASITLDGRGYAAMTGPGTGTTTNSVGSGGGYGGNGGASSLQPGGGTYGSALQPVDSGSSGGFGFGIWTNGSEGGGALRLSVGRALTVNGSITANGNPGLQDNAGGGSGGSLWISANVLTGTGEVLATGGAGELFQGGGGGGGRIAIYSPANLFSGLVSAAGGSGFAPGGDGTIYYASTFPTLSVVGQTPNDVVSYAVSSVDLTFNTDINPYTATGSSSTLITPNGPLGNGQVVVTPTSSGTVRLSFPTQIAEGDYRLTLGSQIQGFYGQPLSPVYTGGFTIRWPVIQGVVADAQNNPIAGVLLLPDSGLSPAQTDATGTYSLKVMPGGNVTIVPSFTNLVFVPGAQSYANVTAPLVGQNYLAVATIAPTASVRSDSNGLVMSWRTIPGVTYQVYSSTNLVDWAPYGAPTLGSNGVAEMALPGQDAPQMFFRIRASN